MEGATAESAAKRYPDSPLEPLRDLRYYKNRYREKHHLARYDPASIEDLGLTA